MGGLWEKIKEHPYITAAIVVGIFILVYLLIGGSNTAPAQTQDNSYAAEVAAATQLQNAQLQAQTQGNAINAQLQAQMGQYQAATSIANLQLQANADNNNAATQVAIAQINAQQNVASQQIQAQSYNSSLNAQVLSNYLTAQQNVAQINASTAYNVTNEPYSSAAALQLAANQQFFTENTYGSASTVLNYLKANPDISLAEFNQVAQAVSPGYNPAAGTQLTAGGQGILNQPLQTPTLIPLQPINISGAPTGSQIVANTGMAA